MESVIAVILFWKIVMETAQAVMSLAVWHSHCPQQTHLLPKLSFVSDIWMPNWQSLLVGLFINFFFLSFAAVWKFITQICEKKANTEKGLFNSLCRLQRNFCTLCLQCHMAEILLWSIQCNKQTSCVLALGFNTSAHSLWQVVEL